MSRLARRALAAVVLPLVLAVAAPGLAAAAARLPVSLTGTYELLAKDVLDGDGHLEHVYSDVLRIPGRNAIPLRLPAGHRLRGGTRVTISAQRLAGEELGVSSVRTLAPAAVTPSTGTTRVLVILAYWSAPDAVTPARARAQIFDDGNRWYREVSYGNVGQTGVVTPWVRIPAPPGGNCFGNAETMLANARAAATDISPIYDYGAFDRTILYFPRCSGADSRNVAGWAYEPGSAVWLNGYMDRRTSVHEQGHNYGLGHARSYSCKNSAGVRVTLGGTCASSEYGDPYDAMGRSTYAAHFSGYRKDRAGWLGPSRKRVLKTATTTFNLPVFEKPATIPHVVVANSRTSSSRSYWMEYRRPTGMDAKLPAGATGGVLVHYADIGMPGWLLDATPSDGSMATAVVKPGTTFASPDGLRVKVVSITSVQARVTVTGARPAPTVPSAPRGLTAAGRDSRIFAEWWTPESEGGSPILGYDVTASTPGFPTVTKSVAASTRSAVLSGLHNDARYTVSVRARNDGGSGPAATAYATPRIEPPTPILYTTFPDPVRGSVWLYASAEPNPSSQSPIRSVEILLDGVRLPLNNSGSAAYGSWRSQDTSNGTHELTVTATDYNGASATSDPVTVVVANPVLSVAITAPATGSAYDDVETLTLQASAASSDDLPLRVTYFDASRDGTMQYIGESPTAPYGVPWRVSTLSGVRKVVARVSWGEFWKDSAPVEVTIAHPASTVTITSPAHGAGVQGPTVPVTVGVAVAARESAVSEVLLYQNGTLIARDSTAPYEFAWTTKALSGPVTLLARSFENTGRFHESAYTRVSVDNVLPAVTMDAPASGAHLQAGLVELRGTALAGPGGVAPSRVAVRVPTGTLYAPVAADGSWSVSWNTGPNPGLRTLTYYAMTPEGLESPVQTRAFTVFHPVPVVTVLGPADRTLVEVGKTIELAVRAAPGENDPARVTAVCWHYTVPCATAPDADGVWRVPMTPWYSATWQPWVEVRLSDGYVHSFEGPSFVAARRPAAPDVSVSADQGSLTVWPSMSYYSYYSEPVPITSYVVTVDGQTRTVAPHGSTTYTGLTPGVEYAVTAYAVNAVGDGAVKTVSGTPLGQHTTGGGMPTNGFALLPLLLRARGRTRRGA